MRESLEGCGLGVSDKGVAIRTMSAGTWNEIGLVLVLAVETIECACAKVDTFSPGHVCTSCFRDGGNAIVSRNKRVLFKISKMTAKETIEEYRASDV
jgi:hypothetical protein